MMTFLYSMMVLLVLFQIGIIVNSVIGFYKSDNEYDNAIDELYKGKR